MTTFHLAGAAELGRQLEQLGQKAARRVLPKAIRAAVKPPLQAARAAAPRKSGTLRKSLAMVIRRYDGAVVGIVGQDKAAKLTQSRAAAKRRSRAGGLSRAGFAPPIHLVDQPVGPHPIPARGRWLKFSHEGRTIYARSTAHPGHRGANFVARAADASRTASLEAFTAKAAEEIDKAAAEGARR